MNKLFKNILYLSSLTFAIAACQEEQVVPGEQDADGCFGVYFPAQEDNVDLVLDPADPTSATITVMRKKTDGAITVPVTVKDTSGLFSYTPITFEDGQSETTFNLTFDAIGIGNTYLVSFSIEDPLYASKYSSNPASIDFTVLREKWNNLGWGTWEEQGYWEFDEPVKVPVYQNDQNKSLFRVAMKFTNESGKATAIYTKDSDEYLTFKVLKVGDTFAKQKVTTEGLVVFDVFDTGYYNPNYPSAPIWFVHPSGFSSLGTEADWQYNKVLAYQNDEAKTPAGIQFAPYYYINGVGGWNYTQEDGIMTLVFPGATLTDYTVSIAAGETSDGKLPVEFTLGADVAAAKYAVYEGELSKAAAERHVNAIVKGTEESKAVPEAGAVEITMDKSGVYTVLAATFDDKGAFQASAAQAVNYVAKGDEETYAVSVNAGLELTSRYEPEGYTRRNSAQFYVYGKDLADLKVGLYATSKLDMDALADVIGEEESVSDSLLNLANTTGWSDLFTGLSAKTEYTLVVWASNGYASKIITADVETDGLPRVKKGTGDYTYNVIFKDDDKNPITDEGLELYMDPNYENTYIIPDWGNGVDFKFTYDPSTGEVKVPLQLTGANSSYGPVYVYEAKDAYSEKFEEYDQLVDSKYGASTNTFEFCVAYIVSAGSFGWGVETFKLDGAAEFASTSGKAVKSRSAYPVRLGNFSRNLPHAGAALVKKASSPALAGIRAEHEAAAAKFSAREIPAGSFSHRKEFTKTSAKLSR